jgi:hypothetical protein
MTLNTSDDPLYASDESSGTWYRIDVWDYAGDGTPVAMLKQEVPESDVPPKFLNSVLGRDIRDHSTALEGDRVA